MKVKKTRKIQKKLIINKETIATLTQRELSVLKGASTSCPGGPRCYPKTSVLVCD
jgi:hypothetical protein